MYVMLKIPKNITIFFKSTQGTLQKFFKPNESHVSNATIEISGERFVLIRASS